MCEVLDGGATTPGVDYNVFDKQCCGGGGLLFDRVDGEEIATGIHDFISRNIIWMMLISRT